MTNTHRAALERMILDLDTWCDTWHSLAYTDPRISLRLIADRARAALVEGAGVEPSDGDAHELWALAQLAPGEGITDGVDRIARFLARYGNAHPRPVPVAERQFIAPFTGFYDNRGQCWCGTAACVDQTGDTDVHIPSSWELREPCPEDDCVLPAAALPLPEGESWPS